MTLLRAAQAGPGSASSEGCRPVELRTLILKTEAVFHTNDSGQLLAFLLRAQNFVFLLPITLLDRRREAPHGRGGASRRLRRSGGASRRCGGVCSASRCHKGRLRRPLKEGGAFGSLSNYVASQSLKIQASTLEVHTSDWSV